MIELKQEITFTTTVSEKTKENEFVIEFFSEDEALGIEGRLIKVTHNFEELLDFLEELEQ